MSRCTRKEVPTLTWIENLLTSVSATWGGVLLVLLSAVLLSAVTFYLGRRVIVRVTTSDSMLRHVLVSSLGPARWAVPVALGLLVLQAAPDELRWINGARHITGLLLIGLCTSLTMRALSGFATGLLVRYAENLEARRIHTQARVLSRLGQVVVLLAGLAFMLMTFPGARQVGTSLLASAGVLGLVVGIAARPVFSNLIAGLQIALTQPIRIDDVLIVNGEWGRVEEITGTYVVFRVWDDRRLVIPLQWFIDNPFENWTRTGSALLGTVFLWVDFALPLGPLRAELERVVKTCPEWDGRLVRLHVTDTNERAMQVRVLVSAQDAGRMFELRCKVREALIHFIQSQYPGRLPRLRVDDIRADEQQPLAA
jgi:small-conductance mechanosensitive channel